MKDDAPKILVVDDEKSMQEFLAIMLKKEGCLPFCSGSGEDALKKLSSQEFDAVITDLNLPNLDGIGVLREVRERQPGTPVIMITAYATAKTAIEALKLGAYDYVMKPFNVDELKNIVSNALEKKRLTSENIHLRRQLQDADGLGGMIGVSEQMQQLFALIKKISRTQSSVLITGESGTGKELAARAIHQSSFRFDKPFVSINCAAMPAELLESELFGHVKGSFTGAVANKKGLFETAHNGTLLLDEIGEMPVNMQAKLLRALQERSIRRIGGLDEIAVDVRLVCTTNRDLEAMVEEGGFREDLFYRINVIRLHLAPLRERPDDIPLLAEHFLTRLSGEMGKSISSVSREGMRLLREHRWPGNIRELENVIERAVALESNEVIMPENLAAVAAAPTGPAPPVPGEIPAEGFVIEDYLRDIEKRFIVQAMTQAGGNMTRAAALLGMSFRSFRYYVKKYELKEGGAGTTGSGN
jgi:two-component system response regulator PilR (NtrC family)